MSIAALLMIATLSKPTAASYIPPLAETVVYEANLRAFGPKVGFNALTNRLAQIKDLGVNVIWIMPIQPVGKLKSAGGLGSPYAVADYDKVNPEFGTAADFKTLVQQAHRRKMAVILDWSGNHTAWDHPWITAHPDWYTKDANGKMMSPAGTNWQDVADLDFSKPGLQTAMANAMQGWIERFGIDGFRCDAADYLPADFWKNAVTSLRQKSPRKLLMLAEGYRADHYDSGFDLTFGWPLHDKLVAIYKGAKATELADAAGQEAKGISAGARRLHFVTNHDKAAWEATPVEHFNTPAGVQTAFVITALYGGTPLIYNGQEVAWPKRIPIFDQSSIDWTNEKESGRWIADLLRLRRTNPVLITGRLKDYSTDDAIIFARTDAGRQALVIANIRNQPILISLPSFAPGRWKVAATGKTTELTNSLALRSYEYRIFIK